MKKLTNQEKKFILNNVEYYGARTCAQKLNRNFTTIYNFLLRNNIIYKDLKPKASKKEIDELEFIENNFSYNFFENTSLKELCYFIGFFWADGTINSGKYLNIEILEEDAKNIFPFFNFIENKKITNRQRGKRRKQSSIFINDWIFAEFLMKMGKYPKSCESHEKILQWIPEEYHVYFLRGIIDGDGCFYANTKNVNYNKHYYRFSLTGRYEQDWDFLIRVLTKIGISKIIVKKRSGKKHSFSYIEICSLSDLKKLYVFLYAENDGIFLKRKYEKLKAIISNYQENRKEADKKRKKFKITYNGKTVIVDILKKYAIENNLSYEMLSRLATKKVKYYKGITVDYYFEKYIEWKTDKDGVRY